MAEHLRPGSRRARQRPAEPTGADRSVSAAPGQSVAGRRRAASWRSLILSGLVAMGQPDGSSWRDRPAGRLACSSRSSIAWIAGRRTWLMSGVAHACPALVTGWREGRPDPLAIPGVRTQFVLWLYVLASATALLPDPLRPRAGERPGRCAARRRCASARADLYKTPAGRNDRGFTLGPQART